MSNNLEKDKVINEVLSRVYSSNAIPELEYNRILERLEQIRIKIYAMLKEEFKSVTELIDKDDVILAGSVARRTALRGVSDCDIFIRFPSELNKEDLREIVLKTAVKIFRRNLIKERYAEHPYVEVYLDEFTLNIVPIYKVSPPNWRSAADRSYFHMLYLSNRLNDKLRREIIIAKSFIKGIGCYGAEVSVKGFSGYLIELLILAYKSFINLIKDTSRWRLPKIIDLEGYYRDKSHSYVRRLFPDKQLIVIDPVDKMRNVASALSNRKLAQFISASKFFLANPSINYFYPFSESHKESYYSNIDLNDIASRYAIITLIISHREQVEDILHGQLERLARKIYRQLRAAGFNVFKYDVYSNYQNISTIFYMLDAYKIALNYVDKGPPIYVPEERLVEFIKKHISDIVWLGDDYRWYLVRKRRYTDAKELIKNLINAKMIGLPKDIQPENILVVHINELLKLDKIYPEHFKLIVRWLSRFIKGEEFWRVFI